MKKTLIIYKCDICHTNIDNETSSYHTVIPCRGVDSYGHNIYHSIIEADLCADCYERYWNLMINNFADITQEVNNPREIDEDKTINKDPRLNDNIIINN